MESAATPRASVTRVDGRPMVPGPDGFIHGGVIDRETFDIVLGRNSRDGIAPVLFTVVGKEGADKVVEAINSATLYQSEGMKAYARAVNRGERRFLEPATDGALGAAGSGML